MLYLIVLLAWAILDYFTVFAATTQDQVGKMVLWDKLILEDAKT